MIVTFLVLQPDLCALVATGNSPLWEINFHTFTKEILSILKMLLLIYYNGMMIPNHFQHFEVNSYKGNNKAFAYVIRR